MKENYPEGDVSEQLKPERIQSGVDDKAYRNMREGSNLREPYEACSLAQQRDAAKSIARSNGQHISI
jgi:hypothetical protein